MTLQLLPQEKQDVVFDVLWLSSRIVALEGLPALGDEELLPVPSDVAVLKRTVEKVLCSCKGLTSGGAERLLGKKLISVEMLLKETP